MFRILRLSWLLSSVLLVWTALNTWSGATSFVIGSESCPEQMNFPPVTIKELIVDWSPEPLTLAEATLFELPKTETGRMSVIFHDLDPRYEFPYYLVIATPYSQLAQDETIPTVQVVADRKSDGSGLVTQHLNLEPGYEYGVEVYALSWGKGVRLSAPPDVEYATTLLSPLFFGAYQVNILFGCDQPGPILQECEITTKTSHREIQTELALEGTSFNSHVLAMTSEPRGSSNARTVYFLDPVTFGPGDYVRSDRSKQVTHVELTIGTVAGVNQAAGKIAYRDRISLDTEGNWLVSEQYYCRALAPRNGANVDPSSRCLGPLAPVRGQTDVQFNPERFRTSYRISVGLPDGTYDFQLVAQKRMKDQDTGEVSYEAVSAPSILRVEIGRPNIFSYTPEEYVRLLEDIEAELRSEDDELELNYWNKLLFPDFEQREALLFALEDLGIKLNSQLE